MRVLILNWRDIKNPQSGGAEIATWELARRWSTWGNQVVWLSPLFEKSLKEEEIEGVKIKRVGRLGKINVFSVIPYLRYLFTTISYYKKFCKGQFNLVLDQIHGLPFFTPIFVKAKKAVLIYEVGFELWNWEVPFPFSFIGRLLERIYFKIYRNIPFITLSKSTKEDLLKVGVKNVFLIPPGVGFEPLEVYPAKEKIPTVIFLGRITKMKRIEEIIEAFGFLKKDFSDGKLWIVGRGEKAHLDSLKRLVFKKGLTKEIEFFGFVSEEKKKELLTRAWVIVSTSVKEGWGLVITEANACGTPAVVYDVTGLRESVSDFENGLICRENTPLCLAENIKRLFENENLREELGKKALKKSREFSWDKSARKAMEILKSEKLF